MGEIPFPGWDPVILSLGWLQIRWYSMMYVVGFLVGHWILTRLARARLFPLPPERVPDLVFWLVLGVMLGGRLGFCIFYRPELLTSWQVIAVWQGGLSFHGGLLGVIVTTILFARHYKVSSLRVLDCLALAVTPGVFAVRCANFINGELYGRLVTGGKLWCGVRFPTDPVALKLLGIQQGLGIREREAQLRVAMAPAPDGGPSHWQQIMDQVPLRHPSQLYEALGEGLVVGLVLLVVYRLTRKRPLGAGVYGGVFALSYGIVRFVIEYFRQPDEQFRDANDPLGTVLFGFTMGQVLCSVMIAYGLLAIFLFWSHQRGLAAAPAGDKEAAEGA